jgi:3-dehydroquinate synthase
MIMMPLQVKVGNSRYPVYIKRTTLNTIGEKMAEALPGSRVFIVSDETVWKLYGKPVSDSLTAAGVKFYADAVPPGEASKTAEVLFRLFSDMAKQDYSRSDTVLALGGGVIGDLAGLASAVYLRGMNFVQAPTTLLSQVDSSIGGKVAVDIPEGKNLVGAFHQPKFVLVDPDVLDTLPDNEFACGMAEIIKQAAIADLGLFKNLEKHPGRSALHKALPDMIHDSLVIKRNVVAHDERDEGPRMVLNFGHTIGHALEKLNGFTGISHGEAVSMGMNRITRVSEALGLTLPGTADRLASLCTTFGLPTDIPEGTSREALIETMERDKKVRGENITLVLLKEVGQCYLHTIKVDEIGRFL